MKPLALILAVLLSACGTIQFRTLESPPVSVERQQLDDNQCHNLSKVSGPWLFGIGYMVLRHMTISRYQDCMSAKGYKVEPI